MIREFITGLAGMLADNSLGVWNASTAFAPTDVAIVAQDVPTQPDQLIVLSGYAVQDDQQLNDSIIGTHVRFRGSPGNRMTLLDRSDAVFGLVQAMPQTVIGGVTVINGWRQGGGWIGRDDLLRWEYADLYYWQVTWPTTHRVD